MLDTTQNLLKKQLIAQFEGFLPKSYKSEITLESKLIEIGIVDSIRLIEFLLTLETEMKINVSKHFVRFQGSETVSDILAVITSIKKS